MSMALCARTRCHIASELQQQTQLWYITILSTLNRDVLAPGLLLAVHHDLAYQPWTCPNVVCSLRCIVERLAAMAVAHQCKHLVGDMVVGTCKANIFWHCKKATCGTHCL